jgi:uncharacterized membrane protein
MQFEKIIATLLRVGVGCAAIIVLFSGICYLAGHGGAPSNYAVFHPAVYSFMGVAKGIKAWNCIAMIEFGLLLLIATPILRVAVSWIEFPRERDYGFAALTLAVLLILLGSLMF